MTALDNDEKDEAKADSTDEETDSEDDGNALADIDGSEDDSSTDDDDDGTEALM